MVAVGKVTSPVTQVAVVAVNNASMYGTEVLFAVLIGRDSRMLPSRMVIKKLKSIICVVDNEKFFFINKFSYHK